MGGGMNMMQSSTVPMLIVVVSIMILGLSVFWLLGQLLLGILQALQGRAAGLNIVTAGGAPGAGANVTIRGGASITQGTEPLYIVDGVIKFNDYEKKNLLDNSLDVRIFVKDLNGLEKTNYLNNTYGTQLYRSTNASTVIPYPIVFPEKTKFSLVILKGDIGSLQLHNGKAYISFIEIDN